MKEKSRWKNNIR